MTCDPVVHVIDDDEAMRTSLDFLLDSAGYEVRLYDSAAAFLEAVPDLAPGCVLTDVRMPGLNGLELTRQLKTLNLDLPIIMMTGHGDIPLAVDAMKAGVVDFLEKPFETDVLLTAIASAIAGPGAADPNTIPSPFQETLGHLSPRETEVLRGVVDGKANKVIAFELGISPRTVEVYRANVMTKTGAASLPDLIRMAMLGGYS
jgi:two-component system response regulator FixJ